MGLIDHEIAIPLGQGVIYNLNKLPDWRNVTVHAVNRLQDNKDIARTTGNFWVCSNLRL
jgi:hypothetical protein